MTLERDYGPVVKDTMQHISTAMVASETATRPPTRRTHAKQQTRAKVLAAARSLFTEGGYEGATIRDIAALAGMSTGAVFANFTDKSELFSEVMTEDFKTLLAAMRTAAALGRGVDDQLLRIVMAGYGFFHTRLPLARAAFSVSWFSDSGRSLDRQPAMLSIQALFAEQLTAAARLGELRSDAELDLRSQMLFDAYLANYVQVIFEGWGLEALRACARDQIKIILAGARKA